MVLGARRLVYLDTADWSYLESGKCPQADACLRAAGERGDVAYLVSVEHFVEISGLNDGLERRIDYLRKFPATMWVGIGGSDILEFEAKALAAKALGTEPPMTDCPTGWMVNEPDRKLQSAIAMARRARGLYSLYARAEAAARRARAPDTHQQVEKLFGFLVRGDFRGLDRWMDKRGLKQPGLRGSAQRLLLRGVEKGLAFAQALELYPAVDRSDPSFDRVVASKLPRAVRRSRPAMTKIQRAWREQTERVRHVPSLSVVAALEMATYRQLASKYDASVEVDKMHAAFSPLCSVFTCDKRNLATIRSILESAGRDTKVLNTGRLIKLADAVDSDTVR